MKTSIYEISKAKTSIKGFWKDDKGKIYIDNIKIYIPSSYPDFTSKIDLLFLQGEKSVFTKSKGKAFLIPSIGESITLTKNFQLIREKLSFNDIKNLLNIYNGLTIFKIGNLFLIDIWQA